MSAGPTRRAALGLILAGAPAAAWARRRQQAWPGGPSIDVSPLRRAGDNTDADFLSSYLPQYFAEIAPGRSVSARIDSVTYGVPGSGGGGWNNGVVDTIEGVGRIDGREVPVQSSLQGSISLPDVGGYQARTRQILLAQSFAQWLVRGAGGWR